ncbi:ABC transporter permease [Paenibacillus flagellatus]|uniref:ABC transporter permease n=1 Tax=Paenibacillus flagellatus TaxID=2211139 RepID=A0A2V5KP35_9BACL|nr:ABC transporter permease [Paenibacillus flagellatus]PYI50206.1 hypothetical protein DLM86_30195 [Paenibacillus flagellatus]
MNPAVRLWKERLGAHLKVVSRYAFYAGQSGFFLFLFAAFITTSYLYGKALDRIPASFPYALVIACWLTPFMAVSPIRTLLRQADLVFLLPMEARMGGYFRRSMLYSFATQSFAAVLAVAAAMPLYRHGYGERALPFLVVLLFILALKFANMLGNWTESGMIRGGQRQTFRLVRWIADAAIIYALASFGFIAGAVLLLASLGAFALGARFVRRVPVNWPYLRMKEAAHRTTMLLFFNWFVDVDDLPNRVKPRRSLSKLADLVPFRRENAFRYLYALTLLRSELFGITLRLTLLALAILLAVDNPLLYAGVYVLFQTVTCVQLSALGRFHRYSVWPALYPIPETLRASSAPRIASVAQLVQAVVLALPLCRPGVFEPWLLALPAFGAALAYAVRRRGQ